MSTSWEEKYVDEQVDRAWLELRLDLAERFATGLVEGDMETIDITTAAGEILTADVDEDYVVIVAGNTIHATGNVDEAAYLVTTVLRDDWEVLHPAFLDSPILPTLHIDDSANQTAIVVPPLGESADRDQLQKWVEATFQETMSTPLRVRPNGDIAWESNGSEAVVVTVRNHARIEIWAVLGREVGFKKARQVIDDLSRHYFGIKFYLRQDRLIMSRTIIASPFAADHLRSALRDFQNLFDKLNWVADKVLSKRAQQDRADVAAAEKAAEEAKEALKEADKRRLELEVQFGKEKLWRHRAERDVTRLRKERDAARAELAEFKATMSRMLGHVDVPLPLDEGDVA